MEDSLIRAYAGAFQVIYDHLVLAFYAAVVFGLGLSSAWVVVRGQLRFLMRFPLWFSAQVDRLLNSERAFATVFCVIFVFNSAAMFLYMISGVVDMLPAIIDFLTGMNIGVVFLAKRPSHEGDSSEPNVESWSTTQFELAAYSPSAARPRFRQAFIVIGFLMVTAIELPALWVSIGMGIGLCRFAHPDGVPCEVLKEIAVRAHAYLLVIVPALALSALAETWSVRLMQAEIRERRGATL